MVKLNPHLGAEKIIRKISRDNLNTETLNDVQRIDKNVAL